MIGVIEKAASLTELSSSLVIELRFSISQQPGDPGKDIGIAHLLPPAGPGDRCNYFHTILAGVKHFARLFRGEAILLHPHAGLSGQTIVPISALDFVVQRDRSVSKESQRCLNNPPSFFG